MTDPQTPPVPSDDEDFGLTDEDVESTELSDEDSELASAPVETPANADQVETPAPPSPEAADQSTVTASAAPATPASPASDPATQPFRFRADGADLPIEGLTRLPNGDVVVPASAMGQMQHYLGNRQQWRQSEQGYRREIDQLKKAGDLTNHPDVSRSRMFWDAVLKMDPDQLYEFCQNTRQNLPLIDAQAGRQAAEARAKQLEEGYQPHREAEERQRLEPMDRQSIEATIGELMALPDYAAVDKQAVMDGLWALRDRGLFRNANEQEQAQWGYAPNQRVIDRELFALVVQREKQVADRLRQATQAQVIQNRNTATLAKTPTPPAPSTRASAPANAERTKPKTREEYEARLQKFLEEPISI